MYLHELHASFINRNDHVSFSSIIYWDLSRSINIATYIQSTTKIIL